MILTILSGWLFAENIRILDQLSLESVKKLWEDWEVQILVAFSLLLQISLIVLGNRRKYNPGTWPRLPIWLAYLLADWVATVALGVLFKKQRNSCRCDIDADKTNPIDDELMAFWAPFLLLHLGGPDTITAYAIADNDLWIRHLLGLCVQTGVAVYVTYTAWSGTRLSFLTIPMLFAGVLKYGERSLALRSANREQFLASLLDPPDPGPNYYKFMEEFRLKKDEGFYVLADEVVEDSHQSDVPSNEGNKSTVANGSELFIIDDAYNFFQSFKRLFVDLTLRFQDRDKSQLYFRKSTSEDAFRVVEIELGFGYDSFYTKAPIIYTKWGCFCRFITSSFTIIVFVLFLIAEKHNHLQYDLIITYILLVGAIILEFYAVILLLSSDWTKLWLISKHKRCFVSPVSQIISSFKTMVSRIITSCFQHYIVSPVTYFFHQPMVSRIITFFRNIVSKLISSFKPMVSRITSCFQNYMVFPVTHFFHQPMVSRIISCFRNIVSKLISSFLPCNKKRWSKSLAQYNLLSFSLKPNLVPFLDDELVQKIVKHLPFHETLEKHWYEYRCEISSDLKRLIFEHFHNKLMFNEEKAVASLCSARGGHVFREKKYDCSYAFDWSTEVEFDQSILIWHIATDLCYHSDGGEKFAAQNPTCQGSKNLSDYMLYLLVMCPFLLPIGIGMMRFRDTCEEAKEFSKEKGFSSKEKDKLRKRLLNVCTEVPPTKVKGNRSKSVLFDGCMLANQLLKMVEEKKWNEKKKWEFICNVWIEILGYAASHCRGYFHAQQLAEGGEFLTHVWLLMAHLGITITEQFQIDLYYARAKLVKE